MSAFSRLNHHPCFSCAYSELAGEPSGARHDYRVLRSLDCCCGAAVAEGAAAEAHNAMPGHCYGVAQPQIVVLHNQL